MKATQRPRVRLWGDHSTALAYRLDNLRDGLMLLLDLTGPGADACAAGSTPDPSSAQPIVRWEAELVMAGWWVTYAALRLRDDIDCPELNCLNASRCQLLARGAGMLRRRGREDGAAEFLMLHDLETLPDWMRMRC